MSAPDALLAAALLRDPAGPLLTYYDDATGERTELSATSLANWVAKTANLLRDDLGATRATGSRCCCRRTGRRRRSCSAPGPRPPWSGPTPDGAAVAFATADRLPEAAAADEVFALSLAPLGRGFADGPPPGARDYSVEVLTMADRWSGRPVPDAVPALDTGGSTVTAGDLVEIALRRAAELGLVAGDRVLSTQPWTSPTTLARRPAGAAGRGGERGPGGQPGRRPADRQGRGRAGDRHAGHAGAGGPAALAGRRPI